MLKDITHCTGLNCKHKEICIRHDAHVNNKYEKDNIRSYISPEECITHRYVLYYDNHKLEHKDRPTHF